MVQLFLPQVCIHCGARSESMLARQVPLSKYLCPICLRQFELFEPPQPKDLIPNSSFFSELPFEIKVGSAYSFQNGGIIQSLIHHFKYKEMPRLASTLGSICCEKSTCTSDEYDYLLPVPLHRTRYSERGYNQSEMLANGISKTAKIPVAKKGLLRRVRQTPSQTGLTLEEREENVRGAFALSKKGMKEFQGKRILIIDDVMTTGATMASVANSLIAMEPKCIDIFAMAAVTD